MKRTKRFELRLTAEEATVFINLEKELGKSRTEIVRHRVLKNTNKVLVDAKELLRQLDALGTELVAISAIRSSLELLEEKEGRAIVSKLQQPTVKYTE